MMKACLLIAPLAVLISVCDHLSERDCGSFDHPDLTLWQADSDAAMVRYMSDDGATIAFNRSAIVLNEPFRGSGTAESSSRVTCGLTATVDMAATDSSLAISTQYRQGERLNIASEDEELVVDYRIEAPVGSRLVGGYYADLSDDRVRDHASNRVVIEDIKVIGGQSYDDVISIDAVDLGREDQSFNVVRQIVMARTFGVVAFTDDEGKTFVRIPSQ